MKLKITATLALAVFTVATASAQTYQWKDANGRTVISDTPPPGSVTKKQTIGTTSRPAEPDTPAAAPAASKAAPKSLSERDMEFKKRQQEEKEKADKAAQEQAAAAERQENCKRARESAAALESRQPIATVNEKGERQIMDDSARQAELARARKIMADSCK